MTDPGPSEQDREQNRATVERMWRALGDFDFEALKACLHPEVHYEDVPTPDAGAHGPDNVVARLSIAWDHIDEQHQTLHHIAADGDVVFLDHTERWTFKTGETAEHRFATMHQLRDGLIVKWSDFWDMDNFVSQFPASFLEVMAGSDGSEFSDR